MIDQLETSEEHLQGLFLKFWWNMEYGYGNQYGGSFFNFVSEVINVTTVLYRTSFTLGSNYPKSSIKLDQHVQQWLNSFSFQGTPY
jgi:hypothetical protein